MSSNQGVPAAPAGPGEPCAVMVDGVAREAVVVRLRGERAYVKYEDGAALYRCAWVPTTELSTPTGS
jgi:hypothetical protein